MLWLWGLLVKEQEEEEEAGSAAMLLVGGSHSLAPLKGNEVPSGSRTNGCGSCAKDTSRPDGRGRGEGALTSGSLMRNV